MKSAFRVITLSSLAFCMTTVNASDNCANVTGEINNNAVDVIYPNSLGFYTTGVANVKVKKPNSAKSEKLTCTLLGEPTGTAPGSGYQYEHLLVCDDAAQSEISFQTYLTGTDVSPDVLDEYCTSEASSPFVEEAVVNTGRRLKGLFAGVSNGTVRIEGCVNPVGFDQGPVLEINMAVVGGEVCYSE